LSKFGLIRRSIYILISLVGIGYEFLQVEEVRWPLVFGYGFIIMITIYSFYVQGLKQDEENL